MLELFIRRQKDYVSARTQDYRTTLLLTGDEDANIFHVYREPTGAEHFLGIITLHMRSLPTTPQAGYYRTNYADLYWPAKIAADAALPLIKKDIEAYKASISPNSLNVPITGETV